MPATASAAGTFASPIQQLRAGFRQHDVAGLQIPVNHGVLMRGVERVRDLNGILQHLL
jgi:hypothetical protein